MPFWTLRRKVVAAVTLMIALTFGWAAVVVAVALTGAHDEARSADAIAVLGAAQYNGRPSPVFRARLDHAATLYQRGLAPVILVTGGGGSGDTRSEADVGRRHLLKAGLPQGAGVGRPAGGGPPSPAPGAPPPAPGAPRPKGETRPPRPFYPPSPVTRGAVGWGGPGPPRSPRGKIPGRAPAANCSKRRGSPPAACSG